MQDPQHTDDHADAADAESGDEPTDSKCSGEGTDTDPLLAEVTR